MSTRTNTRPASAPGGGDPHRNPRFVHLSLDDVRRYRRALTVEQQLATYWRRVVQARIDALRSEGRDVEGLLTRPGLCELLANARMTRQRQTLLDTLPGEKATSLPDLATLWSRQAPRGDVAELVDELVDAIAQLIAYHTELGRRLRLATNELVARYRENPTLALEVLPLPETPSTVIRSGDHRA